jgi:MerR family copper efflux transcriptional regulator
MRITEAAQRLGTSPRMLRYRETLGLLPTLGGAGASEAGWDGRPVGQKAGRAAQGAAGRGSGGGAEHPAGRGAGGGARRGPGHRQFRDQDLAAVALALDLERRLDISPAALAFGLRVLAEPGVRAQVAELGRRIGRIPPPPGSALDFEKERALRLLSMGHRPVRPAQTGRAGPPAAPGAPARPPARRPAGPPTPSPAHNPSTAHQPPTSHHPLS